MPIAACIGVLTGVLIPYTVPMAVGVITAAYDSAFPVLEMSGTVVRSGPDYVDLHIVGRKYRGAECRYVRVYAYTVRADGFRVDAHATRIDRDEMGTTRSGGVWDIGIWRVRPVDSLAVRAEVWVQHSCLGRDVMTRIADVEV